MCIAVIVVNYSKRFPLIIAHNREEDVSRPTSPVAVRDGILSALDLRAGGVAAVGLNVVTGTFVVLTNCRVKGSLHPDGQSRGALVRDVLMHGLSPSIRNEIHTTTFQGDFHLFTGSCFVTEEVRLEYLSNIPGVPVSDPVPTQAPDCTLQVTVKMNEHPSSIEDWQPKIDFLEDVLLEALTENPNLESSDTVLNLVASFMSSTVPISSMQMNSVYPWSPCPELEPTVLHNIIVPKTQLADSVIFGTVSQTVIVVDGQSRAVAFHYRTVTQEGLDVAFSPWDRHTVSYPVDS